MENKTNQDLMEIEISQTAFIVVETGQTILDQPRFT